MHFSKLLAVGVAAVAVLFTTACPRDIANKVAERQSLAKEYNEKRDREIDLSWDLRIQGINVDSDPVFLSKSSFELKTAAQLDVIRAKLNEYISTVGRMIEIAEHGNMDDEVKDADMRTLREKLSNATEYREILSKIPGK